MAIIEGISLCFSMSVGTVSFSDPMNTLTQKTRSALLSHLLTALS